ncbi:MAG: hypothetical protein K9M56_03555 [Victivallales bacterium]|nr:hypothetical protein [Victivallales bacterium]
MKKKTIITVLLLCCCTAFGGWLDKVADTVDTVNKVVNPEQAIKTTIKDVKTSGTKYINKEVQVSGKVMGLAVVHDKKYVVFIKDDKYKIKAFFTEVPKCSLCDEVIVSGIYNGRELTKAVFTYN